MPLPLYPNQFGGSSPNQFVTLDPLAAASSLTGGNIAGQQAANAARIPNDPALESQSSSQIAALLNPGSFFPDTDRMAAEQGAGSGVPGSGAANSSGVRMTAAEQLSRIALGESLLSGADARNPAAQVVNPLSVIGMQEAIKRGIPPTNYGVQGSSYGAAGSPQGTGMAGSPVAGSDYYANSNPSGTGWTAYGSSPATGINSGGDSNGLLPLYPGGPIPNSGLNTTLKDLGLWAGGDPSSNTSSSGSGTGSAYNTVADLPGSGGAGDYYS